MRVRMFDANRHDLRGRVSQLRTAGRERGWDVWPTPSRNALLARYGEETTLALIDCRAESGDLDQIGFRIVETIARHDQLWKRTVPVLWLTR